MLGRLFSKKKLPVAGISILLLQQRLERFSTERLNAAMQRAWRQEYNPQTFFALSIFDGDGATIKVGKAYFTMMHFDHRLTSRELGELTLPDWAAHNAYSSLEYGCPGGVPIGDIRQHLYGFLALLCADLISDRTMGLFFTEEHVLLPTSPEICTMLRSGQNLDPVALAKKVLKS
jgi:hypothetical protein